MPARRGPLPELPYAQVIADVVQGVGGYIDVPGLALPTIQVRDRAIEVVTFFPQLVAGLNGTGFLVIRDEANAIWGCAATTIAVSAGGALALSAPPMARVPAGAGAKTFKLSSFVFTAAVTIKAQPLGTLPGPAYMRARYA